VSRGEEGALLSRLGGAHLVLLRHHLDLQLSPRAFRDYGRRRALLAAKSALQPELRRLELDAHLVRVRALCAQLLGELPNAPLGRHAHRGGDGRAHPLVIWRSKPASAEHREFGHNGLFHHAPAELRTGAELLRKVQPAQLDRSLRPPRALLRCSRHALLGASQQALAGRARLPVRRHLEARRLPTEEVVQPGLQRHPSVARADVAKVPGPRRVPALVAEQRGEGMRVPVGGWEGPPLCAGALRGVVPRGVVCPPVVGACPVCCPPLWWALAPCAGAPPRCCGPDRDHCYDRREATALDASIRSLHGDTRGAATHTPTGRVSGGLGRRTPSSTARSWRSVSRAVVQQPVAAAATAPLPTW